MISDYHSVNQSFPPSVSQLVNESFSQSILNSLNQLTFEYNPNILIGFPVFSSQIDRSNLAIIKIYYSQSPLPSPSISLSQVLKQACLPAAGSINILAKLWPFVCQAALFIIAVNTQIPFGPKALCGFQLTLLWLFPKGTLIETNAKLYPATTFDLPDLPPPSLHQRPRATLLMFAQKIKVNNKKKGKTNSNIGVRCFFFFSCVCVCHTG